MKYEITYLVDSEAKSTAVTSIITAAGAEYSETKKWGQRDLAYAIGDHTKAFYFTGIITVSAPSVLDEIKAKLDYEKVAIRYLVLAQES
jgi:ribosomal protein S6